MLTPAGVRATIAGECPPPTTLRGRPRPSDAPAPSGWLRRWRAADCSPTRFSGPDSPRSCRACAASAGAFWSSSRCRADAWWRGHSAWSLCTEGPQPLRMRDTFPAFVTGDALGNLTPLGLFVSETDQGDVRPPPRPADDGGLRPAIENLIYTLSVGRGDRRRHRGAALQLRRATRTAGPEPGCRRRHDRWCWSPPPGSDAPGPHHHRPDRLPAPPRASRRGRLAHRLEKLRTLEDRIYSFHRRHPDRLLPVLALESAYHAAGVAESLRDAARGSPHRPRSWSRSSSRPSTALTT